MTLPTYVMSRSPLFFPSLLLSSFMFTSSLDQIRKPALQIEYIILLYLGDLECNNREKPRLHIKFMILWRCAEIVNNQN